MMATLALSYPPEADLRALSDEANVSRRVWLNQLAVEPAARGCGHARRLRDLAYSWARSAGAASIGLDTAAPAAHLRALYRRWGFEERETVHWPGKTYDSVIMVRALPPAHGEAWTS
jgi:GNAT superfamily N-acetyltransferase